MMTQQKKCFSCLEIGRRIREITWFQLLSDILCKQLLAGTGSKAKKPEENKSSSASRDSPSAVE
jgi:hypothetical protein